MLLHIVFYGVVSFLFTRAHGVPFVPLSTPRAHILTAPLCGAIAMGAMLPPIPPSMGVRHHSKKHWCLFGGFGFSM